MNGDCLPVRVRPWLGGWVAEFKLVWRTEWYRVRKMRDGKLVETTFPTAEAAEAAAWRAKHKIEEPHINGWVSKAQNARAQANALFRKEELQ